MNKLQGLANAKPKHCQQTTPLFKHTMTQTQDQKGKICSGAITGIH